MAKKSHKTVLWARRVRRVRKSVRGTTQQPRLSVFRSLNHIYAQIIDDTSGHTLAAVSSLALDIPGGTVGAAKEVGKALGQKAKENGIERVCFDRRGWLYHGRVKALADGAREAGLKF
jgi:large subunit ribosomal protein L18